MSPVEMLEGGCPRRHTGPNTANRNLRRRRGLTLGPRGLVWTALLLLWPLTRPCPRFSHAGGDVLSQFEFNFNYLSRDW